MEVVSRGNRSPCLLSWQGAWECGRLIGQGPLRRRTVLILAETARSVSLYDSGNSHRCGSPAAVRTKRRRRSASRLTGGSVPGSTLFCTMQHWR
ncbi:hypothetical protein OBBRIDRAFT_66393 [Obba rivulosa]|uniref:Uncharacterized protein n=1 Tax=Obba rivulosa TaxID=1052685 RepID=A0A8E2DKE2_9APHY|nr:hypothetical protein OBBRIDRAFT_66393 [Obba rivulosa]